MILTQIEVVEHSSPSLDLLNYIVYLDWYNENESKAPFSWMYKHFTIENIFHALGLTCVTLIRIIL